MATASQFHSAPCCGPDASPCRSLTCILFCGTQFSARIVYRRTGAACRKRFHWIMSVDGSGLGQGCFTLTSLTYPRYMHFAQGVSTVSLALVRLIHFVPLRMAQRADLARVWADCERKYQERMPSIWTSQGDSVATTSATDVVARNIGEG